MSPRELAGSAIRRSLAEVAADRALIVRLAASIVGAPGATAPPPYDAGARAFLALEIHRYYTVVETLLERLLVLVDGDRPRGASSHREILRLAGLDLAGQRPAILRPEPLAELTHLLSFRHFVRHAYAVDLAWEHLEDHRARIVRLEPELTADLDRFERYLEAVARAIDREPG